MQKTWSKAATRIGTLAAAALIVGAAPTFGDPISIVAEGSFYSNTWGEESTLRLLADNFDLDGVGFVRSPIFHCQGCSAGTRLHLGSTADGVVGDGRVTTDGRTSEVFLSGRMRFTSGRITVPDLPAPPPNSGATILEMSLPFRFHAMLAGYSDVALTGSPVFSRAFRGSGTATVTLVNRGDSDGIVADSILYAFGPTTSDPVPEPATLLLIGGGLACLVVRRRRRNRPDQQLEHVRR